MSFLRKQQIILLVYKHTVHYPLYVTQKLGLKLNFSTELVYNWANSVVNVRKLTKLVSCFSNASTRVHPKYKTHFTVILETLCFLALEFASKKEKKQEKTFKEKVI